MNKKAIVTAGPTGVETVELTAEQVAGFLGTHPEFFLEHENLLAELSLPHDSGKAVSLLEHQVMILRQRFDNTSRKLGELLENGRRSEQLFGITRELVLALMETRSAEQVIAVTRGHLLSRTDVEAMELIFLSNAVRMPVGEFRIEDQALILEEFRDVFRLNKAHCGKQGETLLGWLFPDGCTRIQSTALCPISSGGKPLALLALGQRSPDHFTIHMETLFLDFIAEVMGAMFTLHLDAATE